MTFYRGQKVVCVDATGAHSPIVKGRVYVVSGFVSTRVDGDGITLAEIRTRAPFVGFKPWRFRPVKTTDISSLTALLNPTPDDVVRIVEADVDADMVEIIEAWSKSDA